MSEKKSEEVKKRDARLKKIREMEGDFSNQHQTEKDVKAKENSDKKT